MIFTCPFSSFINAFHSWRELSIPEWLSVYFYNMWNSMSILEICRRVPKMATFKEKELAEAAAEAEKCRNLRVNWIGLKWNLQYSVIYIYIYMSLHVYNRTRIYVTSCNDRASLSQERSLQCWGGTLWEAAKAGNLKAVPGFGFGSKFWYQWPTEMIMFRKGKTIHFGGW